MSQFFWKTALPLFVTLHFTQAWQLVCFNGSISNSYNVTLENVTKQITNGYIDINKPTKMCAHGYRGAINTQGTNLLIEAYLRLGVNVCAIDYSKEANLGLIPVLNYPAAVAAAYVVSREMAQAIMKMEPLGFNVKTLHMIGHSLGAHLCGNIGMFLQRLTNRTLARITGLDPAGPLFEGDSAVEGLSPDDADFVDGLHTDTGRYGIKKAIGDLDNYVCCNEYMESGVQPGCPTFSVPFTPEATCSHQRSVRLWEEAVRYICQQQSGKAENGTCPSPAFVPSQVTCVGEDTNQTYRGNFYYCTNAQSPFGLGVEGLTAQ